MNILFIHGNYPAQFKNLAADLGRQKNHDIRFLTARKDSDKFPLVGVKIVQYEDDDTDQVKRDYHSEADAILSEQVRRAEIIQLKIIELARNGFIPQLIIYHGGNGIGLFLKQVLPNAKIIGYFEWYFSNKCANLILSRTDLRALNFVKARNFSMENEIIQSDRCVVPTTWQASQFPEKIRNQLSVIFDGINSQFFRPGEDNIFKQIVEIEGESGNMQVKPEELLLSYATRGMEPMRGFPEFMKALPKLLDELPNLKILIGGRDRSAYGKPCESHNGSWKDMILDELPMLKDEKRITYTGLMNYENYRKMLQRTNLHCYLTLPYVTSWSLFEAASCGTPVITNQSPATTGTIESLTEETVLEQIEDIYKPQGIDLMLNRLISKKSRRLLP